ncbi:MAG: tetratricopeptide repeat protein, partial [Candidatus Riflebacteria bacterium]|nr:tetratricopeptide repeat protein [Candidatus Riflebacteria bacterium]
MRILTYFFAGLFFALSVFNPHPGIASSSDNPASNQDAQISPEASGNSQIETLRKALEQNPKDAAVRENLTSLLLKKANDKTQPIGDRETVFGEAAELSPDDFRVQYLWGNALFEQKNFEAASPHFETALNLKPEHFDCLLKAGVSLQNFMKFDEAIALYERARKVNSKSAYLLYL